MPLTVRFSTQYEVETGVEKKTYKGEVFPYITATGDLTVIITEKARNKTVACFAAGTWKDVEVH